MSTTLKKFTKHIVNTTMGWSKDFELLQNHLKDILDQFTENPVLDNYLLEDETIETTTTLVQHKLNRNWRGFIVVKKDANADVWYDSTDTNNKSLFLALKADAQVTVSLIVF